MKETKLYNLILPRIAIYIWMILILIVAISFHESLIGRIAFILIVPMIIYIIIKNFKRRKMIISYIEKLAFTTDIANKDTLLHFPMPLVMVELTGEIIWYNNLFREIFNEVELLQNTIQSFINGLDLGENPSEEQCIFKDIMINGKSYKVFGKYIKNDKLEKNILMLYLIDNSELHEIKKKYHDEKIVIAIAIIDNYDDVLGSTEENKRSQLLAAIDNAVNEWGMCIKGITKKYERDKYIIVLERKHLEIFEEEKFSILNTVKEIKVGNKMPVTLSIGIGYGGGLLSADFKYASAAIDIALGRGGDQVVLKRGEEIRFFGGKSKDVEKRTKVKARVIAYALRELMEQYNEVFIMGHINCDLDALGAALGMYRFARLRNKPAYIVLSSTNPTIEPLLDQILEMPEYEKLIIGKNDAIEQLSSKTLLIVVDTHRPSYTECPQLLEETDNVVVIDHHRRGTDFIEALLTYQETYASSTSELVTEIIQYADTQVRLAPIEAEALYAGIVLDTKSFTFKTGVRTFEAAAFLRSQGVEPIEVRDLLQRDINSFNNIANIIRDAKIVNDNIAISVCASNIKNAQLVVAQAADQMLGLKGISSAFVMLEFNDGVNISGRSLGDINVQVILEKLGGGGHLTTAGAQLANTTIEDAMAKLKQAIETYLKEN